MKRLNTMILRYDKKTRSGAGDQSHGHRPGWKLFMVALALLLPAWLAAELGELDLAFELLDMGYEERDTLMGFVHVYSELFSPALASDPRFKAVLARMGLDR